MSTDMLQRLTNRGFIIIIIIIIIWDYSVTCHPTSKCTLP